MDYIVKSLNVDDLEMWEVPVYAIRAYNFRKVVSVEKRF